MKKYIVAVVIAALVSASAFGSMRSSDHAKRQAQINAEIQANNKKLLEEAREELNLQLKTILATDTQTKAMNAQADAINNFHKNLNDCDKKHTACSEDLKDKNEQLMVSKQNATEFKIKFEGCESQLSSAKIDLLNKTEEIKILNNDVIEAQLSAQRASDLLQNSKQLAMNELLLKAIAVIIDNDLIKSKKTYENQTCTSDKNEHIKDIFNEVVVLLTTEKNITSNNTNI